jgi:hypothetical protein
VPGSAGESAKAFDEEEKGKDLRDLSGLRGSNLPLFA